MERWSGRVAVVTGASGGIGASIAAELTKKGLKVAGLARRSEKIEELSKSLNSEKGKLYAVKCDVSKESEVLEAFKWINSNLGGVDIMVNNAGVLIFNSLLDGSAEEFKQMLDVNVFGLSICAREAVKSMKERGVDDGHVININSVVGHIPPQHTIVMYFATKHAVKALTDGLRSELIQQKSKIRVTSISPGLVRTDMPPKKYLDILPALNPEDIADSVLYALGVPPHVQIKEMIVSPTGS